MGGINIKSKSISRYGAIESALSFDCAVHCKSLQIYFMVTVERIIKTKNRRKTQNVSLCLLWPKLLIFQFKQCSKTTLNFCEDCITFSFNSNHSNQLIIFHKGNFHWLPEINWNKEETQESI